MRAARFLMVLGSFGLALSLAACQPATKTETASSNGPTPQQVADSLARIATIERGHQTFETYCALCHGGGGNGDGDAASAIMKTAGVKVARLNDRMMMERMNEKNVREVIARGGGHTGRSNLMPAWGEKIPPDAIDDLVAFVTSLVDSNPAIPLATLQHYLDAPPGVPADGRALFVRHCSACHGAYGKGDGPFGEELFKAHQVRPRDLTDSTYLATRTDAQLYATVSLGGGHFRKSAYMPSWAVTMTPEQIKSVLAYVREISGTPSKP